MDFEQNKVSQDDLENVSGGEIIETKTGNLLYYHPEQNFLTKKKMRKKLKKHLNPDCTWEKREDMHMAPVVDIVDLMGLMDIMVPFLKTINS